MRLQGKVAVITGAASGIGLAIATRFAAEGASIVAGDWNAQRLDAAVANIQAAGGTIVGARGNIAEQAAAEGLVALAVTPTAASTSSPTTPRSWTTCRRSASSLTTSGAAC